MRMLLSIIVAIFGSIAAIAVKGTEPTLIALSIAVTPLALTIRSRKAARAKAAKLFAATCESVGVSVDTKFAHQEGDSIIALNPGARRIALRVGALSKVYSYDDVRSWEARKVSRAGGAVGFGGVGTVAAGSQNIAASMQADRETGLFLAVRDVDHPEWRVSMFDSADRARWAEILRQEFREGGVAA